MLLEQELRELGWQIGVWHWSSFQIVLRVSFHLTGAVSVEVSVTFRNWLQTEDIIHTAAFIELLPQLKFYEISIHILQNLFEMISDCNLVILY